MDISSISLLLFIGGVVMTLICSSELREVIFPTVKQAEEQLGMR